MMEYTTYLIVASTITAAICLCLGYYVGKVISLENRVKVLELTMKSIFRTGDSMYINMPEVNKQLNKLGDSRG